MHVLTVVNLVHLSRHPVVDAHLLGGHRRLVSLPRLRHRRLFLAPELGALFQVHDGVPGVVVHDAASLRLSVCPHVHIETDKRCVFSFMIYNYF